MATLAQLEARLVVQGPTLFIIFKKQQTHDKIYILKKYTKVLSNERFSDYPPFKVTICDMISINVPSPD